MLKGPRDQLVNKSDSAFSKAAEHTGLTCAFLEPEAGIEPATPRLRIAEARCCAGSPSSSHPLEQRVSIGFEPVPHTECRRLPPRS